MLYIWNFSVQSWREFKKNSNKISNWEVSILQKLTDLITGSENPKTNTARPDEYMTTPECILLFTKVCHQYYFFLQMVSKCFHEFPLNGWKDWTMQTVAHLTSAVSLSKQHVSNLRKTVDRMKYSPTVLEGKNTGTKAYQRPWSTVTRGCQGLSEWKM